MSKLFVSDDEEETQVSSSFHPIMEEDDDPVITEIPIILTSKPSDLTLNAIQFPGRPPNRPYTDANRVLQSRLKPPTSLIEVDVPLDTQKFFDVHKSDEWGGVQTQTLTGVLCSLEGYYVARVDAGELIMCPLDQVAQMRPSLNYIDKEVAAKKELNRLDHVQHHRETVQVVQMSVKTTTDAAPRLGGALLARRKVEESEYEVVRWCDSGDEEAIRVREEMFEVQKRDQLQSIVTEEDYLNLLVKETIVEK